MPKIPPVSKSLELPHGYQKFSYYEQGENGHDVYLNDVESLRKIGRASSHQRLYLYTQHQIYYEGGILKQTRSSPNWEGGIVTFSTCKHHMRTYDIGNWEGMWIGGLCPTSCENRCVLFIGQIANQFDSNYKLGSWMQVANPYARQIKHAMTNPRGDIYTPNGGHTLVGEEKYQHENFLAPENHTRSVEFYDKSPGSKSEREDGKIPKWWRDIEYLSARGRRPPSFVFSPCFLFSKPLVWTSYNPGRAALKLTIGDFVDSLRKVK